ncbi:MAG: D-aminoacyl-tRNA deacylase [Acutalibacteraceae bacterium]
MKAVLQRVSHAKVTVGNEIKGEIQQGFLILLGAEEGDSEKDADALADKISVLRIFTDENDKMNLSLADVNGSVLVISNFTLCADCRKGRRPNFINAAKPDYAKHLYEYFCQRIRDNNIENVQTGVFGADMKVELLNDGPVTIVLNSKELIK